MVGGLIIEKSRFNANAATNAMMQKERRRTVSIILSKCLSEGPLDHANKIEFLLDGMAERISGGKKLYSRWKQQIGSKIRTLSVPNPPLKEFLVTYLLPQIKHSPVHGCAHGGEIGWSVQRSLSTHIPMRRVLSFDMKDAFGQMNEHLVFNFFNERAKEVIQDECERIEAISLLAALCTVKHEMGGRMLPQGSPISAALFNRILYMTDVQLHDLAEQREMKYSRWIDDFIVSSNETCNADRFSDFLRLTELNFQIAKEKVFFQHNACYLLGHKIDKGIITKVSKEEGKEIRNNYS